MALKLMYITNQPEIARIAEQSGVDRIWVDLEYIGKADRQGGMDASLARQSSKDFVWLLVDDGSQDDTPQLAARWMAEKNDFAIQYIHKENGGLHTAYNAAIAEMDTELAVCIDSDDFMPDDAVEKIINCWRTCGSDAYAGIIGLDYDTEGKLIGGLLPNTNSVNLIEISSGKLKVKKGDKKNVVRVDLYKSVAPQKVFPGEKYFNPHYMHLQISEKYDFIPLNECLCMDHRPTRTKP